MLESDALVFPGVGSFGSAVDIVEKFRFKTSIKKFINTGKPFLEICLGLQLLFSLRKESPNKDDLSVLKGKISKIPSLDGCKVPHVGWNSLNVKSQNGILKGIDNNSYVYFVHSYFLKAENSDIVTSCVDYGVSIDASIQYKNIYATQFHPEKSGDVGLKILKNFADIMLKRGNFKCTQKNYSLLGYKGWKGGKRDKLFKSKRCWRSH